jgi:hypothetical protein
MSPASGKRRKAGRCGRPRLIGGLAGAEDAPCQLVPRATALVEAVLATRTLQLIAAEGAQNPGQPALTARERADLLLLVGAAPDDDAQIAGQLEQPSLG